MVCAMIFFSDFRMVADCHSNTEVSADAAKVKARPLPGRNGAFPCRIYR